MRQTKGAIGNLLNRYRAVLKKCHLLNTFGALVVVGMFSLATPSVSFADNVASINGTYYSSLADAVNNAQSGDTIKLLQDAAGDGIKIDTSVKSSITIDLNGYTYTVNGNTVGSSGTETNGFQLLKGGSITFKNGTITSSTNLAKILIQNYSNLTLDKVTLNCVEGVTVYVLSNNNGETILKGGTVIYAPGDSVAFDAFYGMSSKYKSVVVKIEDATIDGKIEYATHNNSVPPDGAHEINISGGNFTDPNAAGFLEEGESLILLTEDGPITITNTGNDATSQTVVTTPDRMVSYQATIDTSDTQPQVTITKTINKASDVLPGLDEALNPVMAHVWNNNLEGVNSQDMGIRFLSRAANSDYIADARKGAATIESAARMAFAGAVPQMTKMASDSATNTVVNRMGFANPENGAKAMNMDGKLVDDKALGLALWIAPLWSNQTGFGMEAGNLDYGYNANLGGISLGADYTWANNIRAGLMFNIGGGYAESAGGDLSETTNSMTFWGVGAYGGWEYNNFAVMADVSYTSTWNSVDQDLDHRMGMGDLEADIQASAISAGLRFEYKLETQYLDLIPHVGARYMSINTWGYDVDNNEGTVLEGDGFQQNIWTFPVGITFSKELEMNNDWYFKPSVDFTVIPAAGDIKAKEDVRFGTLPSIELETQMMDYFTWQGGVGLEFGNDNMSVGVNYTLQAGQNSTGHGVFGMFRYEF